MINKVCPTCEMTQTEPLPHTVIYRDDFFILSHCFDMNIPGYLVLSPVRHITHYYDLTEHELNILPVILQQAQRTVSTLQGVQNVYLLSLGELTKHFHFHIFPRYDWMSASIQAVNDQGILDGALFFSEARKIYHIADLSQDPNITLTIQDLRMRLAPLLS